jgi:hypothetical protein
VRDGFTYPTDGVSAGTAYSNSSFSAFLCITAALALLLALCNGPCQWLRYPQQFIVDRGAPPPGGGLFTGGLEYPYSGPVNFNPRGFTPYVAQNTPVLVYPQAQHPALSGQTGPDFGDATKPGGGAGATIALPPTTAGGGMAAHPIFNVRMPPGGAIPVARRVNTP